MCGIVGYIGYEEAAPLLIRGLQKLEYRGYDSAGVAVYDGTAVQVVKTKGRLQVLKDLTQDGATLPGTASPTRTSIWARGRMCCQSWWRRVFTRTWCCWIRPGRAWSNR